MLKIIFYAPRAPLTLNNYFYHPLRSKGKVMFLQLSMIVFTGRSLSRGVSVKGVSLSRGCLCPGSLCPGGFLSRGSLSSRVSVGRSLSGVLCLGLSVWGVSVQGTGHTATCGWFASYSNAFTHR